VSADSVQSHRKFRDKHQLPFTLIADTDHAISEAYGVWSPKKLFGKLGFGIARTTFVIDREGRIARVFRKVKVAGHADEVRQAVEDLG
jgi:peroxiredoxin Q/BCP